MRLAGHAWRRAGGLPAFRRGARETGDTAESLTWLRTEFPAYHGPVRESAAAVLRYHANVDTGHWQEDAAAARLVAGAVENDHV